MSEGPMLRADAVRKLYGDLEVLRGVTFEVGRGEVKVIIGPSGSGKSTLLRCLALLEEPDAGEVSLEGRRPGSGEVGMVFQRFNLFQNMTALGNVMIGLTEVRRLPKKEAREQAVEFLARVGLEDKADQYPDELSGGQQQRVAIVRALATRPDLIFADEPTGNLDSRTGREVLALLAEASRTYGQSIAMVTHDPIAAGYADRIVFLADGSVVDERERSTPEAISSYMLSMEQRG
jgi:putative ABC transport system ATP-binding protein